MDSYTFDELRAMGCPDGLLIQYVCCTKEEIDRLTGGNMGDLSKSGREFESIEAEFDRAIEVDWEKFDLLATIDFLESVIEAQMYELGTLKLDIPIDTVVI